MNLSASERALVARVFLLPAAERDAAVDRTCEEDPGLREWRRAIVDAIAAGLREHAAPDSPSDDRAAATESGGLQPVAYNLDGSAFAFRIVDPRQFFVTTSFDF